MSKATEALPTFDVDKQGLAKLLERRGKEWAVAELIQNAWDENTTRVEVTLEPKAGKYVLAVADDNPDGFSDLRHAYTLFADSAKKGDPTKRGRFNLGEKLVIALCDKAEIATTTGTIAFDGEHRHHLDRKTDAGSTFTGTLALSEDEAEAIEVTVHRLLPPPGITTLFNGAEVEERDPLRVVEATLRTERADEEGRLRPTTRKAALAIHRPRGGEVGFLYEMGIPVVETGDSFHVDVGQKVPLGLERDNVPPGYLRDVRAITLNATYDLLGPEADAKWVDHALEDELVSGEAVRAVVGERYGDKVVTADPSDREAEKIAASQGHVLIPAGAFSSEAWNAVRESGAVLPAGQVTPSPNPSGADDKPAMEGQPEDVRRFAEWARRTAKRLTGAEVTVKVVNDPQWGYNATYGPRKNGAEGLLTFNYGRLGFDWFEPEERLGDLMPTEPQVSLLIHELGHHYCEDHLSRRYYDALTDLGARLARIAATSGLDVMFMGELLEDEAAAA